MQINIKKNIAHVSFFTYIVKSNLFG